MNEIDRSVVDVGLLTTLVAVMDTGGITAAAGRLGVTQSAVSHQVERLRQIVDDQLFVRSGRGIAPTRRAEDLAQRARELLAELAQFPRVSEFDPHRWEATFTIAANPFQRELLLPQLMARIREQAPGLSVRVVPSAVPSTAMLRGDQVDLVLSPRPPHGEDILRLQLFADHYRVFYDADIRSAPRNLADYLEADHATVVYEDHRRLAFDEDVEAGGIHRHFRVSVPGFDGLAAFVSGTDLITTAPGLLHRTFLARLAHVSLPYPADPVPMFLAWHTRHRNDPAHRWVRRELTAIARSVIA
ncbi:MAG: LysR family transcriptional regulator [Nostocoides sp.]